MNADRVLKSVHLTEKSNKLSAELGLDRTTLTAALKPLEREGLVHLRPDPKDGRARLIAIIHGRVIEQQH